MMRLTLFLILNLIQLSLTASPAVYYANIGDTVRLQCNTGGGQYVCFSTYSFQNSYSPMVMLNNSAKYQVSSGSVQISNVAATDAGFYGCSSNCEQMRADLVSYYLQPMMNGQPIDTSQNFIPIPPLPNDQNAYGGQNLYVVVSNENLDMANSGSVLTPGEIAGLVIGLLLAFIITVAIVAFLCLMNKRRRAKNNNFTESSKKLDKDSTVDYSTIEREYDASATNTLSNNNRHLSDRDAEKRSLSNNKSDISNLANIAAEINTRNVKGPSSYKPNLNNEINLIDPQDLPNIDIGFNNKANSQRSQPNNSSRSFNNQGSYNAQPYQNQLDTPYEDKMVVTPRRGDSSSADGGSSNKNSVRDQNLNGMLPPPPNRAQNKIQFPSRNPPQPPQQQQTQQRYVSNENIHLQQIIKESGFITDMLDGHFDSEEDFSKKDSPGKTGYHQTRNTDRYPTEYTDEAFEQQPYERAPRQQHQPGGIDLSSDFDNGSNGGGVTVVSARTPIRNLGIEPTLNVLPPTNRAYQPQPTKYSFQNQPVQQASKPSPVSLSQRIETTSTPLQLVQPRGNSSSSGSGVGVNRDGATDV